MENAGLIINTPSTGELADADAPVCAAGHQTTPGTRSHLESKSVSFCLVQVLNITTANRSSGIFYSKLMEVAVYAVLSLENSL